MDELQFMTMLVMCKFIGPSPPVDVRGFCNIVGWKMPHTPNGQLLSYDVQVHFTSTNEGEIETIASDQTYIYLRKGSTYRYGGALVRVIQT